MASKPFDEKEMHVLKERFCFGYMRNVLDTPVTPRENMRLALAGKPLWMPTTYFPES